MSIASSNTISDGIQAGGTQRITHYFTDHLGGVTRKGPKAAPGSWTETEYAADRAALEQSVLDLLARREIREAISQAENGNNPDKVPNHQTQAEFDRRLLGELMTVLDAHTFYAALPFFQAVESRGGANANQRASYLGIDRPTYDLIANRFGDVQGVAFFLDNAKGQVWEELPDGYY